MLTRIITSIVALAVFFAVIIGGNIPLTIAVVLVIFALLYEMYTAVTKSNAARAAGYISAVLVLLILPALCCLKRPSERWTHGAKSGDAQG